MTKISYLEKPVTSEVKAISRILSQLVDAVETSDLETLRGLFCKDSSIDIVTTGKIQRPRKEFLDSILRTNSEFRMISYDKVLIRIINGEKASITYDLRLTSYRDLIPKVFSRHITMRKEEDQWRILSIHEVT